MRSTPPKNPVRWVKIDETKNLGNKTGTATRCHLTHLLLHIPHDTFFPILSSCSCRHSRWKLFPHCVLHQTNSPPTDSSSKHIEHIESARMGFRLRRGGV